LTVLALDNSTDQVNPAALTELEGVLERGKPIIVLQHVPLVTAANESLWEESIAVWGADPEGRSRVLLGFKGRYPNEDSERFLDMIYNSNSVAAILAGHAHFYHRDELEQGITQIIADPAYQGRVIEITVKGS
jgi:hypothetical protein